MHLQAAHDTARAIRRIRNLLFRRFLTEEQEDAILYRADPELMDALYWLADTLQEHHMGDDKEYGGEEDEEKWMDVDVDDVCVRVAALRKRLKDSKTQAEENSPGFVTNITRDVTFRVSIHARF